MSKGTSVDTQKLCMRCPSCKNRLLHKADEGIRVRIGGVMIVGDDGFLTAQCHFCKAKVRVPLELNRAATTPRFVMSKSGT